MRTLKCEYCGDIIEPSDDGLKYNGLYFCSMECVDDYINWYIEAITGEDFERDGEEDETEADETEADETEED